MRNTHHALPASAGGIRRNTLNTLGAALLLCLATGGSMAHPPETLGTEEFVAGNPTCLSLAPGSGLFEVKADPPVSGETYSDGTLSVSVVLGNSPQGQLLSWISNIGVDSVVVKGGNGANRYTYSPEATADSGLHAPANRSGKYAAVSHVSFCYDADDVFQGCTRGYWKQDHHFDSWPAGYIPDMSLAAAGFVGAPSPGDSLLTALSYSGGSTLAQKKNAMLAQAVAGLLSAAHPDVLYAFTVAEVLTAANAALASNNATLISDVQAAFDAANNNGCPLD